MYKTNDYVLCKSGVCIVKGIKNIMGGDYYVLASIADSSLKINMPVDSNNIKSIMNKTEADNLLNSINSIDVLNASNDKALEQLYRKNMYGTREELISVLKTTYKRNKTRIKTNRKPGEVDTMIYNEAEKKLLQELCVVYNKPYDKLKEILVKKIEDSLK